MALNDLEFEVKLRKDNRMNCQTGTLFQAEKVIPIRLASESAIPSTECRRGGKVRRKYSDEQLLHAFLLCLGGRVQQPYQGAGKDSYSPHS